MAAVDFGLLGRGLPDLPGYRAALSRSTVAVSSEFNLPPDRHLLASGGGHRADQRQRFQRPFSVAQRDLDSDAAAELSRLNLRPFSSAGTREVIAEAQRIVDKYRERTLSGRWPTDAATRRSLQSARRVAPSTPEAFGYDDDLDVGDYRNSGVNRNGASRRHDVNGAVDEEEPEGLIRRQQWTVVRSNSWRTRRPQHAENQHHHQQQQQRHLAVTSQPPTQSPPALRSPAALFAASTSFADPRRRSLATPLASQAGRFHSRTEAEARAQAMSILQQVGLSDAYRSQAEVEEEAAAGRPAATPPTPQHQPPTTRLNGGHSDRKDDEDFSSGPRPLRTPLASSGYASFEDFRVKTPSVWRHPLPDHVGAGYCDEATRRKVWDWLTEPLTAGQHDYLMRLCD